MVTTFTRAVQVFIDQNLSPAAQSAQLVAVARAGLADLIASGAAPSMHTTIVDGAAASTEAGAHDYIEYDFIAIADAVQFALGFLIGRSPNRSGLYKSSFYLGVNGAAFSASEFDPSLVPGDASVIIYNTQPYSRKVDIQFVGNRKLNFSVPPNLFDDAAQAVKSRFGNSVTATRLSNVDFPGKYTLRRRQMRSGKRSHQVLRGIGEAVVSPGLQIEARGI